jgi:microcystin-dependent protein
MATRRPLIVNSSAGQIQELTDSDGLIGNGTIPVGGIIMWSGTIANIPSGWALCNGSNGTPDLRNRFLIGASTDSGGSAQTAVTGSNTITGGTKDAIVVSHTHTLSGGGLGGSTTFLTGASVSTSTEGVNSGGAAVVDGVNLSTSSGTVTFTNQTVSTEGSSGTNQNLPPYYSLAFIMRTI